MDRMDGGIIPAACENLPDRTLACAVCLVVTRMRLFTCAIASSAWSNWVDGFQTDRKSECRPCQPALSAATLAASMIQILIMCIWKSAGPINNGRGVTAAVCLHGAFLV